MINQNMSIIRTRNLNNKTYKTKPREFYISIFNYGNSYLNQIKYAFWAIILSALSILLTGLTLESRIYAASSGDVVINEIMYNPISNQDGDEFLELYNTTANSIDLSGWCFTNGINLCFGPGTIISANGYITISSNSAQTLATYGIVTAASYSGKLDNGGEKLTLKDDQGTTISSLTYDDAAPWPVSPDGAGSSLEVKNPLADITNPLAWAASLNTGGTPGQQNSNYGITLPSISDVSLLENIASGDSPIVSAKIDNLINAELIYKVMFDLEQTLTMSDDGTGGDAVAGDGVYSAQIPSQSPGSLVRYKVQAGNLDGQSTSPSSNESFQYYPYIVDDGQQSELPIVRWYMEPSDYDDMVTNHLADDQQFSAIVAVGDQIFDNAKVRVKGQSSVDYPKRKYKFELPPGSSFGSPIFDQAIDEFSIQVYFLNQTDMQEAMAWKAFERFGFDPLQNRYARVQRNTGSANSEFIGHYLLIEGYDKNWRERYDRDNGAMYKEFYDKKTRTNEDNSDIQSLVDNITTLQGQELKNYLLDNLNIPSLINYHALSAAIFHNDWGPVHNLYYYRDTEGTGRWEYLPWDLDNAFSTPLVGGFEDITLDNLKYPIAAEVTSKYSGDPSFYNAAILERAIYQFPEFREMFFRRSMNMYDQIWESGEYLNWYDEFYNKSLETMIEDMLLWNPVHAAVLRDFYPNGPPFYFPSDFPVPGINKDNFIDFYTTMTPQLNRDLYIYGANRHILNVREGRDAGDLLLPQSIDDESKIVISEVNYNPANSNADLEFVELYNKSAQPVDISGWRIDGLSYTIPQGSVIPANSYAVIVKNDNAFRETYPSVLVLGQYDEQLSNAGQTLSLISGSQQTVYSITFANDGGWPLAANGGGYTLSLMQVNKSGVWVECWDSSIGLAGTPGGPNQNTNNVVEFSYSQPCSNVVIENSNQSSQSNTDLAKTGGSMKIAALYTSLLIVASIWMLVFIHSTNIQNNKK